METANRHHFNAPSPLSAVERAKLAARVAAKPARVYTLADAIKHCAYVGAAFAFAHFFI